MCNSFNSKKIIIESDRDSICMGDDMSRHNIFTEFPEKTKMDKLILKLMEIHTIPKYWATWARTHNDYKCIRDSDGNWLIDKNISIKVFFKDTKKYIFFDRESFGKKCGKQTTANNS